MPDLIYELLPRLREAKGMNRGELARATTRNAMTYGTQDVPQKTIDAIETRPGQMPKAQTLVALATALEVEPDVFYEWPIALAQEARRRDQAAKSKPTRGGRSLVKEREARELAERGRQRDARPEDGPGTKPSRRRRKGEGE